MLIALDLETTGVNSEEDRIIEVSAVKFEDGKVIDTFDELINPHIPIPEIASHITGITDADVANAPDFEDIKERLIKFIGNDPIVGHFIQFDINFLAAYGIPLANKQYDTFILAGILLPGLPSYSLETISHLFNIEHKNQHRALDDALAAMKLYNIIEEKIAAIPPQTLQEIQKEVIKSNWEMQEIFLNAQSKSIQAPTPKIESNNATTPSETTTSQIIAESLHQNKNLIIESEMPTLNFDSLPPTIIAQQLPFGTNLKPPYLYLSTKRFDIFRQKNTFTDFEITLVIKILIWLSQTTTGDRTEIKIHRDEYDHWQKICCDLAKYPDLNDNQFFKNAFEAAEKLNPIIITHSLLAQNFVHENQLTPDRQHHIIQDAESFEDNVIFAGTIEFTFPPLENAIIEIIEILQQSASQELLAEIIKFQDQLQLFLGITGILFSKYAEHSEYEKRITITNEHQTCREWQNTLGSAKNFIAKANSLAELLLNETNPILIDTTKELQRQITLLEKIFTEPHSSEKITMLFSNETYFGFKSIPLTLHQKITSALNQEQSSLTIISPTLSIDHNFNFISEELALDDSFESHFLIPQTPADQLTIIIPEDLASPTNKNYPKFSTEIILQQIKQNQGHTFIIFNSRKAVESTHHELAPFLKTLGIDLYSESINGSRGKILEKFKNNPTKTILAGSLNFWNNLNLTELPIKHCILQKIPFDPPKTPINQAKSQILTNSFGDYQLPKAIIKLKKITHQLQQSPLDNKTLMILDSRIWNQKYGQTILNSLDNFTVQKPTD